MANGKKYYLSREWLLRERTLKFGPPWGWGWGVIVLGV